MSSDRDALYASMLATAENIRAFADQINSGEYPADYVVWGETTPAPLATVVVTGGDANDAIAQWRDATGDDRDVHATLDVERYVPTIVETNADGSPNGDETSIDDYPLEVVDQRGREFAVLVTFGGPNIWVMADGDRSARLEGYWGGEHVTLTGSHFDTFLNYFIDRDSE